MYSNVVEVAQIVRDYMRVVVSGLTSPISESTTSTLLVREREGAQSGAPVPAPAQALRRRTSGSAQSAAAAGELRLTHTTGALVAAPTSQPSSASATARQVAPSASLDSALLDARFATLEHSVDTLLTSNVSASTLTRTHTNTVCTQHDINFYFKSART